jgi:hypothetical protein
MQESIMARKRVARSGDDKVTYRELRNTPGRVWERLADNEVLTLVAEGRPRAILVPVDDGDVGSAHEAYMRGRALLAAARLRRQARASGTSGMSLDQINALIRTTREQRRRAARRK